MHSTRTETPSSERARQKLHVTQPSRVRVEALHYPGSSDEQGDIPIPCVKLRGLWMRRAGIEVGSRLKLELIPGGIQLTVEPQPDPSVPKVRQMGRLQRARLERADVVPGPAWQNAPITPQQPENKAQSASPVPARCSTAETPRTGW